MKNKGPAYLDSEPLGLGDLAVAVLGTAFLIVIAAVLSYIAKCIL